MAKIGSEVSGDKELGWIGRQAEGVIVVEDGIVWPMVVVGGWFGCMGM